MGKHRTHIKCAALIVLSLVLGASPAAARKKKADAGATPVAGEAQGKAGKTAPATKVDLNTASEKELTALPGVGKATAKKIVAARPYSSVADLSKAGVSAKTIAQITPMVTVSGPSAPASAPAAAAAPPPAPAPRAVPKAAPASGGTGSTASAPAQVPPQAGMVWVNLDSKVFHQPGSQWYGKTKNGKFMTEADAIAAGYREAKKHPKKAQ